MVVKKDQRNKMRAPHSNTKKEVPAAVGVLVTTTIAPVPAAQRPVAPVTTHALIRIDLVYKKTANGGFLDLMRGRPDSNRRPLP